VADIKWYVNRLKTMSFPELGFRTIQFIQKQLEKKGIYKISHRSNSYKTIFKNSLIPRVEPVPSDLLEEFKNYQSFEFFVTQLDLNQKIDWHYDVINKKSFPLTFSKDINIRSQKYGSAKVVWEINRLQFLLPLAFRFATTQKKEDLYHWMNIVTSWVNENPYLKGINWYSNIEVNIRLIVWYYCWQVFVQDENVMKDERFTTFMKMVWLPSIYEHCIYSYRNPSKFSSANNHLISEYSGLFIASCCWEFEESSYWRNFSKDGLEREMVIQHSKNGINKEEAAEYIQFITDFFLYPLSVGETRNLYFSETYRDIFKKICSYLVNLLDISGNYRKYGDEDDGKVLIVSSNPHFNNFNSILVSGAVLFEDGNFKTNGKTFDIKNWLLWGNQGKSLFEKLISKQQASDSTFYPDEGHFIFRKIKIPETKEIYLHFDAAPLGFLTIAAHGHADALSIALHFDGDPILVDAGTYTYHTEKEWRNYFISTLAHNTICIDRKNQALQAGPTMWLNHYKTSVLEVNKNPEQEIVWAEHDGYKNINCTHKRKIIFNKNQEEFIIEDEVSVSDADHQIYQPWHLHPDIEIISAVDNRIILKNKFKSENIWITLDRQLTVDYVYGQKEPILGWYSGSFMKKQPTNVVLGKISTNKKQNITFRTSINLKNEH
jgi:hypothetical protein